MPFTSFLPRGDTWQSFGAHLYRGSAVDSAQMQDDPSPPGFFSPFPTHSIPSPVPIVLQCCDFVISRVFYDRITEHMTF